ncbi:hypothetical protein [Actinoallomurus sp. NPDC050550]|uniref:hypothetical protein n=1 Tax=Actinoallomurus sp. NPDC050550 TaxID=3154937 RepID=UPI0033DD132F
MESTGFQGPTGGGVRDRPPGRRTDPPAAETRVDQACFAPRADPHGTDAAPWLARLRGEFPRWGFIHDPFADVWIAVRGRGRTEVAATAFELCERLTAASQERWRR